MIEQADSIPRGTRLPADVCIVGGGAAGISLALSLSGRGLSILLLEGGGEALEDPVQALYEGEVADEKLHSPPHRYRQRRLGGSTAIWGGRCMPYDPIDFERRDWVPGSGWPIGYDDLAPFYPQANLLSEAGRFGYDAHEVFGAGCPPLIAGFQSERIRTTGMERFSCPTNFGQRYAKRLRLAPDIRVLLGANCTGVKLAADGASVQSLEVKTLGGNQFFVDPRTAVLATGGLETARLLLASNDVVPQGVGNLHDVVGRYYMCHIAGNVGSLVIKGPTAGVRHGYEVSPDGIYCRRRLTVQPEEQRRHQLVNAVARLHFPRITDPAHRNGVLSGLFLVRNLISYEYGTRLRDTARTTPGDYVRHMLNVATDAFDTTAFLTHWVTKRTLAERKFPSVILRNRTNRFSLEVQAEQRPLADSRITLAGTADGLGMPRLRVDWRYSRDDIESVARTLDILAEDMAASGVGRFSYQRETLEEDLLRYGAYGGHHIGTARMGDDPRTSVVDADCQVHGVRNLYVAGSAAFPTSSQANPTLTIVALSLRLAECVGRRLKPQRALTLVEATPPPPRALPAPEEVAA